MRWVAPALPVFPRRRASGRRRSGDGPAGRARQGWWRSRLRRATPAKDLLRKSRLLAQVCRPEGPERPEQVTEEVAERPEQLDRTGATGRVRNSGVPSQRRRWAPVVVGSRSGSEASGEPQVPRWRPLLRAGRWLGNCPGFADGALHGRHRRVGLLIRLRPRRAPAYQWARAPMDQHRGRDHRLMQDLHRSGQRPAQRRLGWRQQVPQPRGGLVPERCHRKWAGPARDG